LTKESQQKDSSAQGNDENNRWGKVKTFFRENPTLVLTLMYVDLTGIGILYSWLLYRQFGINIFDFAEIGDFLLVAFKAPAVTFSALLAQVLFVALPFIIVRVFSLSGLALLFGTAIAFIVLLTMTLVIPVGLAYSQADAIKQVDEQAQATVRYRTFSGPSSGQVTKSGVALIGSTQKVVFFYDVDENYARTPIVIARTTIVIPHAQIVWIEVPDRGVEGVGLFE
jgi:hypothetical protein